MIASGGLSGGFSSAIAGGNFWQGVKQGIITSGLNHAVNHVVEELSNSKPRILGKMKDEIKKANLDPKLVESALFGNKEAIIQIIEKLPTLNDLFNNVLEGNYKINVECNNDGIRHDAIENKFKLVYGEVKNGGISLYEYAFESLDRLVQTVAHEGYHYYNARFERSSWKVSLFIKNSIDEYTAYKFDYNYTGNSESLKMMNLYKEQTPLKYR